MSSSVNNENEPIVRNLKHIIDTTLQQNTFNDELLVEQLSRIIEQEESFNVVDRKKRSVYSYDDNSDGTSIFDGSGDSISNEVVPPFYSNMSITTITMGTTTTAFTKYTPHIRPSCRCEKGARGEKGDAGVCPADCKWRYSTYAKECFGAEINFKQLVQSVRQLIIDSKKITYRNAQARPCVCTASLTTTIPTTSTRFMLDHHTYMRLKGNKGDTGTSCSPACMQSKQANVQIFRTLQEAQDSLFNYPDHTYIHVVNNYGLLEGVFIKVHDQLIPLRLESRDSSFVQVHTSPPSTLPVPKTQCSRTLPCQRLHLFALGPYVRHMCDKTKKHTSCSRLSDYDDLCKHNAKIYELRGFYRAFMSTSGQWLSNLFADICINASIVNTREQTLFTTFEDIFQQKAPQNEILDTQGLSPRFHYFWHGTTDNGKASKDTCHDWSRYDSSLSGIASRMPGGSHGLFHRQYTWPCSIPDANMGILCIETNCYHNNYYID